MLDILAYLNYKNVSFGKNFDDPSNKGIGDLGEILESNFNSSKDGSIIF